VEPSVVTKHVRQDSHDFASTRWSLILVCAGLDRESEEAQQALSELCRIYWRSIFSFVLRRGYSLQDAQDLTQDFFVMILDPSWLRSANPTRGKFRSLLLKSLSNFSNDAAQKRQARKRGGAVQFVAWDEWMAESPARPIAAQRVMETWSAEQVFDQEWASTVTRRAARRLQEECESGGRMHVFETLRSCLAAEREDVSYAALAAQLNVSETTVKRLVYDFRERYRVLLRHEVAQTVADQSEIDAEIRYLCGILGNSAVGTQW
jgi:RNA polymerase sigma factor (sigma-70 family)